MVSLQQHVVKASTRVETSHGCPRYGVYAGLFPRDASWQLRVQVSHKSLPGWSHGSSSIVANSSAAFMHALMLHSSLDSKPPTKTDTRSKTALAYHPVR